MRPWAVIAVAGLAAGLLSSAVWAAPKPQPDPAPEAGLDPGSGTPASAVGISTPSAASPAGTGVHASPAPAPESVEGVPPAKGKTKAKGGSSGSRKAPRTSKKKASHAGSAASGPKQEARGLRRDPAEVVTGRTPTRRRTPP